MDNIVKGALLLLCAMAWTSAAPLPSTPPCPPNRNATPNTPEQYRQMVDNFRGIVVDTKNLFARAEVYFKDSGVPNDCFMVDTGILVPTSYDPNRDFLAQLVQYYYGLARFAFHTGESLNEEEQMELKLQPSFYPQLSTIKKKLLNGTITLRTELVTRGYGCVEDLHTNSTANVPAVCPERYIGLVKVIAQLNTAASQVTSLLLLTRDKMKEE